MREGEPTPVTVHGTGLPHTAFAELLPSAEFQPSSVNFNRAPTASLMITAIADAAVEGAEVHTATVVVRDRPGHIGSRHDVRVTILPSDGGGELGFEFARAATAVPEGGRAEVLVRLAGGAVTETTTIGLGVAGEASHLSGPASVTFAPGDTAVRATFFTVADSDVNDEVATITHRLHIIVSIIWAMVMLQ